MLIVFLCSWLQLWNVLYKYCMSHFSALTDYLHVRFCIWTIYKISHDTDTVLSFEIQLWSNIFLHSSYGFSVSFLWHMCVFVCVCGCVWFTAVYIANSGWALFNKPYLYDLGISRAYKPWMKAAAKLIKFNRIKMWLVTQRDIKIALLNGRKKICIYEFLAVECHIK